MAAPDKVRIPLDQRRFPCIGRFGTGQQFMAFVTGAMPSAFERGERWDPNCRSVDDYYCKYKAWYAVLHIFDAEGNHLKTRAQLGGMDSEGYHDACDKADMKLRELLDEIRGHSPKFGDIYVRPFDVEVESGPVRVRRVVLGGERQRDGGQ